MASASARVRDSRRARAGSVLLAAAAIRRRRRAPGPAAADCRRGRTWCCSTRHRAAAYDGHRAPRRDRPARRASRSTAPGGRGRPICRRCATAPGPACWPRPATPAVLYRCTTALNGFAATLTRRQVKTAAPRRPGAPVERSTVQPDDAGPRRRRLRAASRDGTDGAWARTGGAARAGQGVVIGVVDTGIWPENPSFDGVADAAPGTAARLPGFHGDCAVGEAGRPRTATTRWSPPAGSSPASARTTSPAPSTSPPRRHRPRLARRLHRGRRRRRRACRSTASASAPTSAMAPAARLAVYKACWTAPDPADDGCTTADSVAAVDRAVGDGVDVLNYSVSGEPTTRRRGRAGLPRRRLRRGLRGDGGGQPRRPARHGGARRARGSPRSARAPTRLPGRRPVLGDGRSYVGAMVSDRGVPAGRPGARRATSPPPARPPSRPRVCAAGSLDAARAEGKSWSASADAGARVDKSAAVARAGGVGMVLANTRREATDADVHAVPTVHLTSSRAAALVAYVRRAGDRATVTARPRRPRRRAAAGGGRFSARGPCRRRRPAEARPDRARASSVLGAVAPPSDSGRLWDLMSGTSVSAPHVAGLAAVIARRAPGLVAGPDQVRDDDDRRRPRGAAGPVRRGRGPRRPGRVPRPGPGPRHLADRVAAGARPATVGRAT